MTPQTYLELGGWRGGTLEFDFRSTRRDAFLLYQPLPGQDAQGPWNEAQLYVMVKGGKLMGSYTNMIHLYLCDKAFDVRLFNRVIGPVWHTTNATMYRL